MFLLDSHLVIPLVKFLAIVKKNKDD